MSVLGGVVFSGESVCVSQIYNLVECVGALAGRPIIMQRGVDLSEDPGISPPVRVA